MDNHMDMALAHKCQCLINMEKAIIFVGSICFGSLIIAVISTLRVFANQTKHEVAEDNDTFLCIITCCIECILACIEDGIEILYCIHFH